MTHNTHFSLTLTFSSRVFFFLLLLLPLTRHPYSFNYGILSLLHICSTFLSAFLLGRFVFSAPKIDLLSPLSPEIFFQRLIFRSASNFLLLILCFFGKNYRFEVSRSLWRDWTEKEGVRNGVEERRRKEERIGNDSSTVDGGSCCKNWKFRSDDEQ